MNTPPIYTFNIFLENPTELRAIVLITYYKIEEQESERYRRNRGEISYSFMCIVTHTKAPYL